MLLLLQSPPLVFVTRSPCSSSKALATRYLTLPLLRNRRPPLPLPLPFLRNCRPPHALPLTDQELLHALADSFDADGDGSKAHLPAVRSYESDLACLTLVGAVSSNQAITAAAADGGDAAEEHLASRTPTMVVETVFPGSFDEHSTVSTRLFLPTKKVKEKAKKLRGSLTADILSGNPAVSKNILALTFRQVVLQRLWNFKLSLFCPGTERNMDDLSSTRKVLADFTVSSSDERFLSALAEVVCSCALESTRNEYLGNVGGSPSRNMFDWFQKPKRISSVDSSVYLYRISQGEIVKNARNQLEKFNLGEGRATNRERKVKHRWWAPPNLQKLDKAGGPGFSAWTNEFIPAYRLQIDASTFKDANLEGWKRLDDNRWEALLTHFQMVELANILDMYYEDRYTLPDKQISCGLITETLEISRNKRASWEMLFVTLAGGCVLIFIGALAQLCWPHLLGTRKASELRTCLSSSEIDCCHLQSPEATELEALCISVVKKIKDELGWPGDIMVDKNVGAWTGILPSYLRNESPILDDTTSSRESAMNHYGGDGQPHPELFVNAASPLIANKDMQTNAQDIASYQVVLSRDGKVIGFQPTSRVAVNHWASNPLAKVLYEKRELSPGLLEPGLKIPRPHEVISIELLMSVNPESCFAVARPTR